jgi:hypothetical protein
VTTTAFDRLGLARCALVVIEMSNITTEDDPHLDAEVTILFPNDPARRLKIQWKNKKARRNPDIINIEDEHSTWSVAGVSIGTHWLISNTCTADRSN